MNAETTTEMKINRNLIFKLFLVCLRLCSILAFSNNNNNSSSNPHHSDRRKAINAIGSFSSVFIIPNAVSKSTSTANAIPSLPIGGNKSERRQLELCLVSILRVQYWAETVALSIVKNMENAPPTGMTDLMKGPYIEARLGAKAALTGKIGGGSNAKVYLLGTIKLRDCIKDAQSYYNESYNREMKDRSISNDDKAYLKKQKLGFQMASEDIIESLAAVVEFDGLDNIQDPSPRSSLALSMYNDSKATFVKRLLLERTVVSCATFVSSFGTEKKIFCEKYVKSTYPNEIPTSLKQDL